MQCLYLNWNTRLNQHVLGVTAPLKIMQCKEGENCEDPTNIIPEGLLCRELNLGLLSFRAFVLTTTDYQI